MISVLCTSSFDLHRIRSKRIAKSLSIRQRTWTRGTGSAWGHQRIAHPRSPQFLIVGEVVWAHTSPYTHCIPRKNAPSPFKVQAWRHLEKSEIWHTQPGNGIHLGVLIFWGQGPGWPAEWSWGSAKRGEGGRGQMGHVKRLRTAPNTSRPGLVTPLLS